MNLSKLNNVDDMRRQAKRRLPLPVFNYLDGGADDEWSLKRNTSAFENYELLPSYLNNVEQIDLTASVLGSKLDMPLILSPTGMSRLFHHEKEPAVARAAEKAGAMYSLSTMATCTIEEIGALSSGPKMFQIYILKDRELTREFVQRCKDSKYEALCLTVDTAVAGNRERDLVSGFTLPPRLTLKSLWSFASHPYWTMHLPVNPGFRLTNVVHRVDSIGPKGTMGIIQYVNEQFDRTVTWEDVAWLVEQWDGPFVIKGIQTADDARKCVEVGASAIMISNHGGRQLDSSPAPVDCVAPIRDAVGDALELIVDGGIKRGTHILKALALGADACSIGRSYLYALACGGQKGVEHVLELLRNELERDMGLMGCTQLSQLDTSKLQSVVRPT
jgi:L-lactate dehydrogenase (cytochrome)